MGSGKKYIIVRNDGIELAIDGQPVAKEDFLAALPENIQDGMGQRSLTVRYNKDGIQSLNISSD